MAPYPLSERPRRGIRNAVENAQKSENLTLAETWPLPYTAVMQASPAPGRTDTLLQSLQSWDTLVVTGPDRCSWLDGLVTCDAKNLLPGQASWGLILSRLGKIQSCIYLLQSEEALWLCLAPDTIDSVFAELDKMLIMEDAELEKPNSPPSWVLVHGPDALLKARQLAEPTDSSWAELDTLGIGGALMKLPPGAASELQCLSSEQWTSLRLERGMPEIGKDYSSSDRPHEAGLERKAVNWNKGCYLGQEVVCTQDMRGKVKKSSRVLRITAPADIHLPEGLEVGAVGGAAVGRVTSLAYSERASAWVAMARLKMDKLDTALEVRGGDDLSFPAKLCELL